MDKNQIKRGAVVAASAATLFGLVFATPSFAATSSSSSSTSSSSTVKAEAAHKGKGKEVKGAKGQENKGKGFDNKGSKGDKVAPADQTVNVYVPADGKTYTIKVTETAEKGVAVATPVARPSMPLAGTGSQNIKLPLGASDTYKIELVAADGTVVSTVTVTVAADGTVATPIVLG